MNPIVSVVMPTYKGSDDIEKTIRSIQKQTYTDIQIIIVDDNGAGTDEQVATEKVVQQFPEVEYYKHEVNKNGSAARNTGIAHAKGKYVAFLDDDDVWKEDKIALQVQRMEALDDTYAMVYGPFLSIDARGKQTKIEGGLEGRILYEFLMGKVRIGSSLMMVRTDVLREVNGFDESFRRHQDWELICRILARYQIAYESEALTYKYMKHRNSPKSFDKIVENRLYFLSKMEPYIAALGEERKKEIYVYHYTFLAKEALKQKKLADCWKWIRKTEKPAAAAATLVQDALSNIAKRVSG